MDHYPDGVGSEQTGPNHAGQPAHAHESQGDQSEDAEQGHIQPEQQRLGHYANTP
jgi:Predicted Zn-dependent protease (DUF2268)